jgi:hypothetical protein
MSNRFLTDTALDKDNIQSKISTGLATGVKSHFGKAKQWRMCRPPRPGDGSLPTIAQWPHPCTFCAVPALTMRHACSALVQPMISSTAVWLLMNSQTPSEARMRKRSCGRQGTRAGQHPVFSTASVPQLAGRERPESGAGCTGSMQRLAGYAKTERGTASGGSS